ncbi:kelch-like protein 41 [Plakobranchus ocellatus]|uniref:Kelch-like protein 41 n=1 Tax=Plakobranchus ocellatus TaxID=259542 RepID=A0AAV3XZS4_9GAST|nr:kelch-like protein 41 [Plakobranchus ocellatus]
MKSVDGVTVWLVIDRCNAEVFEFETFGYWDVSVNKRFLEGLHQLFSEKLLCDFTLQAGSEQVDVHRCVLAACSPYFKAMLTLNTYENTKRIATLQNVDSAVLLDLVNFMYKGEVSVSSSNAQSLLVAADMLQIQGLVQLCEEFMSSSLCAENCLDVFSFADFQNLTDLKEISKLFVLNNFESIYCTEAFLSLNMNHVKLLLSSDELNVSREEVVYEALILWIKHDLERRKNDLMLLLFCVRFPLIDVTFINSKVSNDDLIKNNVFCSQLIKKFLHASSSESHDPCKEMFCNTLRLGMFSKNMIVFSGGAFSASDRAFCCLDPLSLQSFYSIKHHPTFDFKFKLDFYRLLVTESNDIYFLGGIFYDDYHFETNGGVAKNDVLVYNQKESKWLVCAAMNMPRCAFGACCFEEKLYVFGGYTAYPGHPPLENVAAYDTHEDIWVERDGMPIGIAHQASAVFRNTVFLFGGVDADGQYLNTVLQYHFGEDRWNLISTEMPIPRAEASAFVHNDRIVILGGSNSSGGLVSVNIFNFDRLRWSHGSDFPEQRKFTSICQGEGYLYVCGGVRQSVVTARQGVRRASRIVETKDLYRYDLSQDMWVKVTRLVEQGCSYTCLYASVNSRFLKENKE